MTIDWQLLISREQELKQVYEVSVKISSTFLWSIYSQNIQFWIKFQISIFGEFCVKNIIKKICKNGDFWHFRPEKNVFRKSGSVTF